MKNKDKLIINDINHRNLLTSNSNLSPFKLIVTIFVPLLISFLISKSWAIILYSLSLLMYYTLVILYFFTEVIFRPPWYVNNPGGSLPDNPPDYWNDIINNPYDSFNIEYEDVTFTNIRNQTLRGWYIQSHKVSVPLAPLETSQKKTKITKITKITKKTNKTSKANNRHSVIPR